MIAKQKETNVFCKEKVKKWWEQIGNDEGLKKALKLLLARKIGNDKKIKNI